MIYRAPPNASSSQHTRRDVTTNRNPGVSKEDDTGGAAKQVVPKPVSGIDDQALRGGTPSTDVGSAAREERRFLDGVDSTNKHSRPYRTREDWTPDDRVLEDWKKLPSRSAAELQSSILDILDYLADYLKDLGNVLVPESKRRQVEYIKSCGLSVDDPMVRHWILGTILVWQQEYLVSNKSYLDGLKTTRECFMMQLSDSPLDLRFILAQGLMDPLIERLLVHFKISAQLVASHELEHKAMVYDMADFCNKATSWQRGLLEMSLKQNLRLHRLPTVKDVLGPPRTEINWCEGVIRHLHFRTQFRILTLGAAASFPDPACAASTTEAEYHSTNNSSGTSNQILPPVRERSGPGRVGEDNAQPAPAFRPQTRRAVTTTTPDTEDSSSPRRASSKHTIVANRNRQGVPEGGEGGRWAAGPAGQNGQPAYGGYGGRETTRVPGRSDSNRQASRARTPNLRRGA